MPIPALARSHPASGGVLGVLAATGADHEVDLDKLIAGRLLLCANSGGGKSRTLRRLLESTFGVVPHHVIDPEGEFHTLRDAGYEYILAGKGYDCPTEPAHAQHLARKMLELGASVVLDLYELEPQQRIDFVAEYVRGLIDAPKHLWQPALIVIDEAHTFCPEKGEEDGRDVKACRSAVISLMSLGRKRGFCGVLATQRLAKLAKSAAAEANNVLIGRARQDVDADRALKALGARVADHDLRQQIRALKPGHFFASGPALGDDVVEILVGDVRSTHPEAGAQKAPAAPPPATVKRVLAQLADLPQQAAAELRTVDDLRARVRELEDQVTYEGRHRGLVHHACGEPIQIYDGNPAHVGCPACEERTPAVDVAALVRLGVEHVTRRVKEVLVPMNTAAGALLSVIDLGDLAGDAVEHALEGATEQAMQAEAALADGEAACVRQGRSVLTGGKLDGSDRGPPIEPRRRPGCDAPSRHGGPCILDAGHVERGERHDNGEFTWSLRGKSVTSPAPAAKEPTAGEVTGPMRRVLDAIAWFEAMGIRQPSRVQVAFMAGYSPKSTAYTNPVSACNARRLLCYPADGVLELTDAGRVGRVTPKIDGRRAEVFQQAVLAKLPGPQRKILSVLIATGVRHAPRGGPGEPKAWGREQLARETGYSPTSTAFTNPLSNLHALGLATYPTKGTAAAAPILFVGQR